MHHFQYRNGTLYAEDVNLQSLAEDVGTPFYCYSTATLERHYKVFTGAFSGIDCLVCFAIKANSNISVLKTLARLGAGMDVVSEGELRRALAAGVPGGKIVFSGVGKTRAEMALALQSGIFGFNVESEAELRELSGVASGLGKTARIAFRVNPDVDAKTHHKISTGKAEHKFGVPYAKAPEFYRLAASLPNIAPAGIHMHIGSQITDLQPYSDAFTLLADLALRLRTEGHNIEFINLGGGLGVPYRPDEPEPPHPDLYAEVVRRTMGNLGCKLVFEPGRLIAGNAGILVSRVIYTKPSNGKRFVIVDAAMNDLVRPTLYDAYHDIWPVSQERADDVTALQEVVGPVCETGDFLAKNRRMPLLYEGDLVAFMTAGAYGAVQSSAYNSRLLVPEILVRGRDYSIVRPRPTYEQMLASETVAPWLSEN